MVENILILGNGFDLAMGRQTSYEDFLRFLNSLSVLLYCQKAYNQQIDVKDYDFLLEEYNNPSIAVLTKEELQEQIQSKDFQIEKKIKSKRRSNNYREALNLEKFLVSNSEGNDAISYFDKLNFQEELKLYELLPDKVKLGVVLECLSNHCNIKNEQLENFFEENKNDESAVGIVRKVIIMGEGLLKVRGAREKKDDIESKYLLDVDIIDDLIQKTGKEYKWLLKIRDNLFLKYINENKYKLGKKWSSIELVISDIAEAISYLKRHLEEFSQIFSNGSDIDLTKIQEKFITKPNFAALSFVTNYQLGQRFDYGSMGFQKVMDVCNEKFIQSLEELTDYLEFYLTYLDKLDFEKQKIEKKESNLDVIEELKNAKVLTFNYTNTAKVLLEIPEKNTHFIHGRIDFARDKKTINTMVFGIEDKEDKEEKTENINPDLISYQKFYQRIIKETGSDYRKFFENPKDSGKSVDDMNIIVFGHSVDPLDKEIFKKCFKLAEERGGKYKFIFNYYDEKAKREIVKNLTIILGKEKMISLTAEQKVAFVKCDDVQRMERELL